ncbi:MAG: RNA 2',3'-cyclic phosphodiesterase [Pseudomonadota bacterium]
MRLFIGLFPDLPVRAALAAWRDGWNWPRSASPVRTEQLHLTLHFIGDVEPERVPQLAAALPTAFTPFELQFGRAVLWPHGVAVLEPDAIPASLLALHADIGAVLRSLDLPLDTRAYRPHVTLARRAGAAAPPHQGPAIKWKIDRYALMESTLGPGGGYTRVQEY